MAIASVKDIQDAFEAGRFHSQRFIKTTATGTGDGQWHDWSFAAGQPAYDARIGDALTCTPMAATRNDAIYFPGIDPSMERRLLGLRWYNTASGTGQLNIEGVQCMDILAVYPLIDGDSTDIQEMDNTLPLPRYADGEGVQAILVNHVAPGVAVADFTINYINNAGNARVMTGTARTYGTQRAAWTLSSTASSGPLYLPLDARCKGVRSITDIQFATAPGGLWCIYLVRPLTEISNRGGSAAQTTIMTQKCLCAEDAFHLPRIYDGAWIGFFMMPNGGARAISTIYGTAGFIWG